MKKAEEKPTAPIATSTGDARMPTQYSDDDGLGDAREEKADGQAK